MAMYEIMEDKITLRMRKMLGEWLAREDWQPRQLIDWLQGYDLPPVGHGEEPYLWLLRGLPPADERYEAEIKLASRVARILEDKPDEKRPGTRPDEVLYNLFMLCAGLNCADQLARPLYGVFKRGVLKGEWLGVDLRYALQTALILNQVDDRLYPVWKTMLETGRHDFLPGDENDGLEGVRFMPPSSEKRGEPAIEAIGMALKAMAIHLDQDEEHRTEFRSLINKIVETYPGRPTWDIDLLYQAGKNQWLDWAMQSIPGMQGIPTECTVAICKILRRNPNISPRAVGGILVHELTRIEKELQNDDPKKEELRKAHCKSLKNLAVGASCHGSVR
ncbi:MAG: hypothetical protein L0229_18145 [Blastocatellia bacterium]|nr:hypothetical protein [Blastocatellia bacterium]